MSVMAISPGTTRVDAAAVARLAHLLADDTRAAMCLALLDGRAWTAGELAREVGVSPSTATVHLDKVGDGYRIERIDRALRALIPGIDAQTFQQLAVQAKNTCPLSRARASVPRITLIANLLSEEET